MISKGVPAPRRRRNSLFASAILMAVICGLAGCATSFDKRGRYHRVRSGESIWRIASVYRVDVQQLAEYNNVFNPNDVQPGMHLYIPPRPRRVGYKKLPFGGQLKVAETSKKRRARKRKKGEDYNKPIRVYRGRFVWPVNGKVTSPFGVRNGQRHDGIDISAKQGTPIRAAAAGRVVFSGKMRGYGNLILVRHKDDFFTAYAHNRVNKARKGQWVKQGQSIAQVGRTGRASGAHLHFEIRNGQTARNPLFFLPERKGALARR
jgi:murein DD-endopeptidase MepM/ murein hydrolase activator NlpD